MIKFSSSFVDELLKIFISPNLVIEHLPQELRDRFTEMREMDLQVQSKFGVNF